jgi:hypothetical protein
MTESDINPELDAEATRRLREVCQAAIRVTSTAYTRDASIDVQERLRAELAAGGVEIDDDDWLRETAAGIRSGHSVQLVDPNAPGSLGGDNGGG